MASDGASNNERLIAAARSDNEDMLLEVFEEGKFDINAQDGLGNTALHYAASHGYLEILEHLLEYDGCDVDLQNRIEKATPLHLALQIDDPETRAAVVSSLLEAGADTKIKDKNGETPLDLVPPADAKLRSLFRKSQAQASIAQSDVANDDDDDEDGSGSGSGSDDE
ncbi:ankyrin [Polyporus arcularius HHB13444]|uniref:Ankyrin n=1 Tax=Polyporus arcularius HHB13444 TaxID=1314778 RepID=A0A5C3PBJ9_9APHY|nr:ankyrin [Polyporus arcularius HHB13444]